MPSLHNMCVNMSQVEQVMKLQKWGEGIRYPVLRIGLNIASKVLSAFADRVGAYSLLPLVLAWSDSANTIAFVWLWFACVYVGHLLKDSLQIPRPPVPPVTVKESAFSKEFGFPSCHAMISSAFVYASMCSFRSADSVPSSFFHLEWINMLFMLIVVSCVGLSRVFLGVHFPMDVYGGICLGTVATFVYRPVLVFYMTHAPEADFAYASLVVTGVMLSLIVLYRAVPVVYTSAYITVAEVGGVTLAFTLGVMADDMLISGESFQFSGDDKLMTLYFQSVVFCLGCVAVVRPAVVSRLQSFIVRHTGKPYVKASSGVKRNLNAYATDVPYAFLSMYIPLFLAIILVRVVNRAQPYPLTPSMCLYLTLVVLVLCKERANNFYRHTMVAGSNTE